MYNLTMVRAPFLVYHFLEFFSFFTITYIFVLGPLVLTVYLMRKISKFWKSRKVGGLNFGLWLKKIFFELIVFRFAWCKTNSHLLLLHAINLEVESKCAYVCFVLSIGFLKHDWNFGEVSKECIDMNNALIWLLDYSRVTAVIVSII